MATAAACTNTDIEKLPGQVYRQGELIVAPKVPDDVLGYFYLRAKEEGVLARIFHEEVPSLKWFLEKYMDSSTCVLGCYRQAAGKTQLEGLAWINHLTTMADGKYRKAEVGEGFFRKVRDCERYARISMEWAFCELQLDAIFGTTPEPNRAAVEFARKLGFRMVGPLSCYGTWHGDLCACWLSEMTRGRFEELKLEV